MTKPLGHADPHAPWAPLQPWEVDDLFGGMHRPWWIAGGWAIDLFLGRQTRPHADTDFEAVLPLLSADDRRWLRAALIMAHPGQSWLDQL